MNKVIYYKNLVYDLVHHESPIAQWLERPTGIMGVHGIMGSTLFGGSENSFSEYFNLRTLLHNNQRLANAGEDFFCPF